MSDEIKGLRVSILVTNGFELMELLEPRSRLEASGATVQVVSLKKEAVRSWDNTRFADELPIDLHIDEAQPGAFDALLLPGGVINADYLRMDERAVRFVSAFTESRKPIAAISHGPAILINAHGVAGRRMTSYPSLRLDFRNAGAEWLDESVVIDKNLVTSRRPDDLPQFCHAFIEVLKQTRQVHRER
jgi:protease I